MHALHFGAGSIGRGFIGDLLHQAGYGITFVDTNAALNQQINDQGGYTLYMIEQDYQPRFIPVERALSPVTQRNDIIRAFIEADVVTTAVWADNLAKIAPLILDGLQARRRAGKKKINVIACENALFSGAILRREIVALNSSDIDSLAAFPDTAVDRMVLAAQRDGQQVIDTGIDYELVIDSAGLAAPEQRPVPQAIYTDNLQKYLERKLYIINGGHAWAGYVGHLRGYTTMQQIFADEKLRQEITSSMRETATLLHYKYGFPPGELENYIQFVIRRFCTPGIVDTVQRVCRSPVRKLAPGDRLIGPCIQCSDAGLPCDYLIKGIAAALHYNDPQDEQSVLLQKYIAENNVSEAITYFTGINENHVLHEKILLRYVDVIS